MTATATWITACPLHRILPDTGACVRIEDRQVAIFRFGDDQVFAIDNRDPFSGANVLSRGIVGDADGVLFVASPILKQRFALADGRCLDNTGIAVTSWPCRVVDGMIEIDLG